MTERRGGTRFRLFPQAPDLAGFSEPEVVEVSRPPGSIAAGPTDRVMYVVDAFDKRHHYEDDYAPPYRGPTLPPALPGPEGHFDHIPTSDRAFLSAHMYGSVRFVLDIWEGYLGRPIWWYDPRAGFQVELIPEVDWDNAHAGVGFIETGGRVNEAGDYQPFALNFDVLAHEVGHTILFSELGLPDLETLTGDFLAYHESVSDVIALISALHFEGVLDDLIRQTGGNLYALNWLNRIGELSATEQIRVASNDAHLEDLDGLTLGADGEWHDPSGEGRKAHDLSQPLTGAIFDALIEVYQDGLVRRGVIDSDLDVRNWTRGDVEASLAELQTRSGEALLRHETAFVDALREARDTVGRMVALTWLGLSPHDLSLDEIAAAFLDSAEMVGQTHNLQAFADDLAVRGFDIPRGVAQQQRRRPLPPPPRSAPYTTRAAWAQANARAKPRLEIGADRRQFDGLYRMINHDFRI